METIPIKKIENQALVVGVDLGIKHLATLSNGETVEGAKPLKNWVVDWLECNGN